MEKFEKDKFIKRFASIIGSDTQQAVGLKIGLNQGQVSKLLNGDTNPSLETIFSISKAYGVSTDYLLGTSDEKTTNEATKSLCKTLGLNDYAIKLLESKENKNSIKRVLDFLIEQHILHVAHSKINREGKKNLTKEGKKIKTDECYSESLLLELNRFLISYRECDDMCIGITSTGKFLINTNNKTVDLNLEEKVDLYPLKTSMDSVLMTKNANNIFYILQKYIEKKEMYSLHNSGFEKDYLDELLKEYIKESSNDTTSET